MAHEALDRKGLIREAYRIEGITPGECRSIFLDWALALGDDMEPREAIRGLLQKYESDHPNHPMTAILREGLVRTDGPKRRGGWRGRPRH